MACGVLTQRVPADWGREPRCCLRCLCSVTAGKKAKHKQTHKYYCVSAQCTTADRLSQRTIEQQLRLYTHTHVQSEKGQMVPLRVSVWHICVIGYLHMVLNTLIFGNICFPSTKTTLYSTNRLISGAVSFGLIHYPHCLRF